MHFRTVMLLMWIIASCEETAAPPPTATPSSAPAPAAHAQPAPTAQPLPCAQAYQMAARFEALWADPERLSSEIEAIRFQNPEWDFMHRTFLVLALMEMSLADPGFQGRGLALADKVIDDTLRQDRANGPFHFLMAYGHSGAWVAQPPRSLFVDGEIALMLGARRMVQEKEAYRAEMQRRVDSFAKRMLANTYGFAESYPNECWLFCNTVALAATVISDKLDGADHSDLRRKWLASASSNLVHKPTGMLISAYALDGSPTSSGRGPEGSSIWLSATMLQVIDAKLADQQYRLARTYLGRVLLGLGYSKEWPDGTQDEADVDSGFQVADANSSASGLAILASRAFQDPSYHAALLRSLALAGAPQLQDGQLQYEQSNLVGDAVVLYGLVNGPLWHRLGAGDSGK